MKSFGRNKHEIVSFINNFFNEIEFTILKESHYVFPRVKIRLHLNLAVEDATINTNLKITMNEPNR